MAIQDRIIRKMKNKEYMTKDNLTKIEIDMNSNMVSINNKELLKEDKGLTNEFSKEKNLFQKKLKCKDYHKIKKDIQFLNEYYMKIIQFKSKK